MYVTTVMSKFQNVSCIKVDTHVLEDGTNSAAVKTEFHKNEYDNCVKTETDFSQEYVPRSNFENLHDHCEVKPVSKDQIKTDIKTDVSDIDEESKFSLDIPSQITDLVTTTEVGDEQAKPTDILLALKKNNYGIGMFKILRYLYSRKYIENLILEEIN